MYKGKTGEDQTTKLYNCLADKNSGELLGINQSASEEWKKFGPSLARALGVPEEYLEIPREIILTTTTALLAGNNREDISCSEEREKVL